MPNYAITCHVLLSFGKRTEIITTLGKLPWLLTFFCALFWNTHSVRFTSSIYIFSGLCDFNFDTLSHGTLFLILAGDYVQAQEHSDPFTRLWWRSFEVSTNKTNFAKINGNRVVPSLATLFSEACSFGQKIFNFHAKQMMLLNFDTTVQLVRICSNKRQA